MEYRVKVHWGDTDAAGIVFYPNYYKWMDEATHELFSRIGYPTQQLLEEQIIIPLLETHCVFKKPVQYNVDLSVQLHVDYVKDKIFKVIYSFFLENNLVAEGYSVRAWATLGENLRAVSIPNQVRDLLLEQKLGGGK
ncbi:acyl-CoA thioesterase [Rummeliibacillus sp. NPDC094406]|uniref:acyl-CoA thioesterase n=1 Tax=Rummeliibacillus sp. NPDC094406 TaxID=3364511 RepID=UPI0038029612